MNKKAVVLVSGGLDSATTLAFAKSKGYSCYALTINYGQKHIAEINAAKNVVQDIGAIEHKFVNINLNDLGGSALLSRSSNDKKDNTSNTNNIASINHSNNSKNICQSNNNTIHNFDKSKAEAIPNTYVPARNTTFLSIALGYAEAIGAFDIFIGACQIDYSGYPDCREQFIQAFENLANLATKAGIEGQKFSIHAPLLNLTKAETIKLGLSLNVDYSKTVSCYRADDKGFACGTCDSCEYRKKGFRELSVADNTYYC